MKPIYQKCAFSARYCNKSSYSFNDTKKYVSLSGLDSKKYGAHSLRSGFATVAAESGADYVKIQSMLSKELTHRPKFDDGQVDKDGNIKIIKRPFQVEFDRLKKLDLDDDAHFLFLEMCKKYKVKPMTTIFSRSRLKLLEKLNLEIENCAS